MKTTFRPTPEQQAGMKRIAKALGKHVKTSDVMAWAVDGLISYFDAHGGKQLLMPPNFSQTFSVITLPHGVTVAGLDVKGPGAQQSSAHAAGVGKNQSKAKKPKPQA